MRFSVHFTFTVIFASNTGFVGESSMFIISTSFFWLVSLVKFDGKNLEIVACRSSSIFALNFAKLTLLRFAIAICIARGLSNRGRKRYDLSKIAIRGLSQFFIKKHTITIQCKVMHSEYISQWRNQTRHNDSNIFSAWLFKSLVFTKS